MCVATRLRFVASDDPYPRVVEGAKFGYLASESGINKDYESKSGDRQRLVDDVIDVLVAKCVPHSKEHTLLTHDPRLKLTEKVGVGRSKGGVLLCRCGIDHHISGILRIGGLSDREKPMLVLGPTDGPVKFAEIHKPIDCGPLAARYTN